ncbi:sensor histidine kinase [Clostridiales bacterium BAD-6]|uniref:histidine kinase n=1 Tax=Sinanaerobacter chloroacetimidivorans TaxID=2818044 RepID=A0A8J7W452_9FIRM|nr:sensor histidine kinase [Sinanaerobacter chloroacetimidivorans]
MKLRIDLKSLKFKIWIYFAVFAALLMLILWFLQIFFLNTYYQEMKISQTKKIARTIMAEYGRDDLIENISALSYKNDMYIHIETSDGTIIFTPGEDDKRTGAVGPALAFMKEMSKVRNKLLKNQSNTVSIILPEPRSNMNTLAYGAFLDRTPGEEVILYIFSPLYPVESTVDILASQLVYVTIISLLLAFALSFLISNKLTRPIVNITKSASKLAKGDYGVIFEGGYYSEINQLADTLNHTSKELAKADNLQKDLIANVSHDLRTPLTMVKSYAEMIRDLSGDNPEKRNSHLQVIIDEADRLNLLVSDLLQISKMQSGVESLHISTFNMKDTILSILNSYHILSEQEGYCLCFQCDRDIFVTGDESRIKQVISNLVNNAVRYCGEDKKVTISLTEMTDYIRCEVTDTGKGIPESELEHIWERYYKASTNHSRNKSSGTGLGLSIVKEILLLHHARFGVNSVVDQGSTFWFELQK